MEHILVKGIARENGAILMKDFIALNEDFGTSILNIDLRTYNKIVDLTVSVPGFKKLFNSM